MSLVLSSRTSFLVYWYLSFVDEDVALRWPSLSSLSSFALLAALQPRLACLVVSSCLVLVLPCVILSFHVLPLPVLVT